MTETILWILVGVYAAGVTIAQLRLLRMNARLRSANHEIHTKLIASIQEERDLEAELDGFYEDPIAARDARTRRRELYDMIQREGHT